MAVLGAIGLLICGSAGVALLVFSGEEKANRSPSARSPEPEQPTFQPGEPGSEVSVSVMARSVEPFFSGRDLPAGRYRITYQRGAMRRSRKPQFQWQLGWTLVLHSYGREILEASPGEGAVVYKTQELLEQAYTGSSCVFDHEGGVIGIYLADLYYRDNDQGDPNPTYSLERVHAPLPGPTGLRVDDRTPLGIELSWQDNSGEESGFRVERRLSPNPLHWGTMLRRSSATGNHYAFVGALVNASVAQAEARTLRCLGVPGHLATISSQAESDFVRSLWGGHGWIGGFKSDDGIWRWSEGPEKGEAFWEGGPEGRVGPAGFANWSGGEPNNNGGPRVNEDRLMLSNPEGSWNDTWSRYPVSYYVEFETHGVEGEFDFEFVPLARVAANTTSFTDNSTPPDSLAYEYRIVATSDSGDSLFSKTVSTR